MAVAGEAEPNLMSLFIGVDSGTQSVKALVLDMDEHRVVARASAPHALIAGLPANLAWIAVDETSVYVTTADSVMKITPK